MADDIKLSPVEAIKEQSRYLRGSLAEELAAETDHFSEEGKNLIKFHGSYQQEDRDARKNRPKGAVASKAYCFMIRLKLPGGKLTAPQYLVLDRLCEDYANGTLRLTTRQSIQFHGILKKNLKETIVGFNQALVTSLGGCGDVNRNVMACPAPLADPVRKTMQDLADQVAEHLAPKSGLQAYHEIWLNGVKQDVPLPAALQQPPAGTVEEPIYGRTYLPRKFKCAFALPEDNCTDILANCLGFLAVVENRQLVGFNLYAAGGQGRSNSRDDTFAQPAACLGFITVDQVLPAAEAVIKMYRDLGNRKDRKRARFKYVLADLGYEKFREIFVRDYWKQPLAEPRHAPITGLDLHHGWQPQGEGRWFLGLSVENGRIKDEGPLRLRSGLREIVARVGCSVRISAQQDVLLCDIATADRPVVDRLLQEHGIPRPENLSMVRKLSMACPAIPTCPLAITESERALPQLTQQLETQLQDLGLDQEPISVRMTGCPNGCARPYQSEIGLVGRGGTKYTLFIGGDTYGRRLNAELKDSVPIDQIPTLLNRLFTLFKKERQGHESFGDFCVRVGLDRLQTTIA